MYTYAVLVAVMIQRLGEVVVSRYRLAREEPGRARLLREPLYPAMVLVHVGWLAGCWVEVLLRHPLFHGTVTLAATAVWLVALLLRLWMLAALGPLWHVRVVARRRQPVVTSGPYRFIRHPNYVAVVLEVAAVPLIVGAYWTALVASVANALVLVTRIRGEEAYLMANPAYRRAFAGKKRFIPGLF